jgi:hypothetical protein
VISIICDYPTWYAQPAGGSGLSELRKKKMGLPHYREQGQTDSASYSPLRMCWVLRPLRPLSTLSKSTLMSVLMVCQKLCRCRTEVVEISGLRYARRDKLSANLQSTRLEKPRQSKAAWSLACFVHDPWEICLANVTNKRTLERSCTTALQLCGSHLLATFASVMDLHNRVHFH